MSLSFTLLFALSFSAYAAEYGGTYNNTLTIPAGDAATASEDIAINVTDVPGLELGANTSTNFTQHQLAITVDGVMSGASGIAAAGSNITFNAAGSITTTAPTAAVIVDGYSGYSSVDLNFTGTILSSGDFAQGAYIAGADNRLTMSGDITTEGRNAFALYALYGGTISMDGTVATSGQTAHSLYAHNAGSTITMAGSVDTTGQGAYGLHAFNGGTIDLSGDVTTGGASAYGVAAVGGGSTVAVDGTVVTNGTTSAHGLYANDGGTINQNGNVTTSGGTSYGAWAGGANSTITMSGDVRTSGSSAFGVYTTGGGTISLGGDVETSGNYAYGVMASGTNSTVTMSGDVLTDGHDAHGVYASGGGNVSLSGDVDTSGDRAYGLHANGANAIVTMTGDVDTTGMDSHGLYAYGGGAITLIGNAMTSGDYAHGVYAGSGGTADLSGDITTKGSTAHAVYATGTDSAITTNGTVLTTGTSSAYGLYAVNGGSVNHIGGVTTSGGVSFGAVANGAGATITISGDILTGGSQSYGAYATNGGAVSLSGDVITSGASAHGIVANGVNSTVVMDGDILTTSNNAHSVYALNGGAITLSGDVETNGNDAYGVYATANSGVSITGDVITSGENAHGVAANGANATIEMHGDVLTTSNNAHSVYALNGGAVALSGDVETNGDDAYGVYATASSDITITGDVITSGNNAHGVTALADSSIDVTGNVAANGANAHGLIAEGNGMITMQNGAIAAADNTSWNMMVNSGGEINLTNVTATSGWNLLYTSSDGIVTAVDSELSGDIFHDSTTAGVLDVTLTNTPFTGTANVVSFDGAIDLTLRNSDWYVTGDSWTNGALDVGTGNTVDYGASALGTLIKVDSLSGDGSFMMKTNIEANTGDKLVVESASSGTHTITVANYGGAAVTGKERVTLVETADTNSTFSMTNGSIELGAFEYGLGNFASGNGQDWILYATGASNPGSTAVNSFIASYLLQGTDTLMQRLGDLRNETLASREGAWFRAFGTKFSSDARDYVKGFDMDAYGVQVGYDHRLENSWFKNGETYVGAFIGNSHGDVDNTDSRYGTGNVEHRSMGMYWTYMKDSGYYFDAVAKYVWMRQEFDALDSSGSMVHGGKINTGGAGVSFETGKRFSFGETGRNGGRWYAEPQLQLTWQHYGGASFNASNGLRIGVKGYDSLIGRVGLLLGYTTQRTNVYAKFSYLKEFNAELDIYANGVGIGTESLDDNWFVYGLGVTHRMNDRNALYLDIERSSGGDFEQSWRVNGGWRISF